MSVHPYVQMFICQYVLTAYLQSRLQLVTAYDIAGPAYRVIVPAVIQIAYLRQKSLMLELSISPEQDDDDEINESDDE